MQLPTIPIPSVKVRLWLYGVVLAVLPLLVTFHYVPVVHVPLWLNLAGAILGTGSAGTALAALTRQLQTGEVEPTGRHAKREPE